MRQTIALAAACAGLTLAACGPESVKLINDPPTTQEAMAKAAILGCDVTQTAAWAPENGAAEISLNATVSGPDCARAVVLLTVRSANGEPLLAWSGLTRDIFYLYDAGNPDAMQAGLRDWIDQPAGLTTASLPDWTQAEAAAQTLPGGEFPFHPEEWIDRDEYLRIRAEAAPMLSFPQGHESMAMFVLRDGYLEQIGVHQFPG